MLALSVLAGSRVLVRVAGVEVVLVLKSARTGEARLLFDAPQSVRIWRAEIAPPLPTPAAELDRLRTLVMAAGSVAELDAAREAMRRSCVPLPMLDASDFDALVDVQRRILLPQRQLT